MAFLKNEFDARGVVAMRNLVPPEALNALRAECSQLNDQTSAQALIESDCKSSIRIVSNLIQGLRLILLLTSGVRSLPRCGRDTSLRH